MLLNKLKNNHLTIFLILLAIAYSYGVLSASHYGMYSNDFYLSLAVSSIVGFATIFGLSAVTIKRVGFSTLTWLALAIIIMIQPALHTIHYADGLIFPFGVLSLAAIVSIVAVNITTDRREYIIKCIAWLFLVTGCLSVVTQFIQLFYPNSFSDFIAPISKIQRLYGNIAQPNTASFINVLAIVSSVYLYYLNRSNKMLLFVTGTFIFLVIGITFTLSRAGILLLGIAVISTIFYSWNSHKIRFLLPMIGILLSIIAYQCGMWLIQSFSTIYQGSSGVERLVTGIQGANLRQILLERAWSAFSSNPIVGVGYDNFYSHSVKNIESYTFFETADHSHNVIAQIGAEFGLLGLLAIAGVIIVLVKQIVLFFQVKLPPSHLFLCLLLFIFVSYSFSEFPLWYPKFLLIFAFLVGLLDNGLILDKLNPKKALMVITLSLSIFSTIYTGLYHHYLTYYEMVVFAKIDNQQKIDAYHAFPNIFGFSKSKDYMLHMVVDVENPDNFKQLIVLGDKLMEAIPGMDIARIQTELLMKLGKQEEADMLNRRLCVWENQNVQHCDYLNNQILAIDPDDKMGYAKRLNEWYHVWLIERNK